MYGLKRAENGTAEYIMRVIPHRLCEIIDRYMQMPGLEEIRFRVNRPAQLQFQNKDVILSQYGAITPDEIIAMLHAVCMNSVYAVQNELRMGFVTLPGGIRIGLSGKPIMFSNEIKNLTSIQSFNIRIPHEIKGCAEPFVNTFIDKDLPASSIIASRPGVGKTTFLRDLARCFSNGIGTPRAYKTALADERNELSGSVDAVPMLDVGMRTDVMSLIPKSIAMPMLIRSMSPELMITDELMTEADFNAVSDAVGRGISVIASIHSGDLTAIRNMKWIKAMDERGSRIKLFMLTRAFDRIGLIDEEGSIICGSL